MSKFNESYNEYYRIIEEAQILNRVKLKRDHPDYEYFENHHIIPDALGGSNSWRNMVLLTPEEHYICHSLLPDFCEGPSRSKMLYAWHMLNSVGGENGDQLLGVKKYDELRRAHSINVGKKVDSFYNDLNFGEIRRNIVSIKTKKMNEEIASDKVRYDSRSLKISNSRLGEKNPGSKSVNQIDVITGEIIKWWPYAKLAAEMLNINYSSLNKCARGEQSHCGGFNWEYCNKEIRVYDIKNSDPRKGGSNVRAVSIFQLTKDKKSIIKRWDCISDAANFLKIHAGQISNCCNPDKANKTAGGFGWEKVSKYSKEEQREIELTFS